MDSGTISQLVFLIFGVAVFIYGFVVYGKLSRLRAVNDEALKKLSALVGEFHKKSTADSVESQPRIADLQQRVSTEAATYNTAVQEYNARIGQFPEAIVAAIAGLQRRPLFKK